MSYRSLFEQVQLGYCNNPELNFQICDKKLRQEVEKLSGRKVVHIKMDISPNNTRGYFLRTHNLDPKYFQKLDCDLVLTPKEYAVGSRWERFVLIKELMHVFEVNRGTDNEKDLRSLVTDFSVSPPKHSSDMKSEINAFWKALSLLCHEDDRVKLVQESRDRNLSYGAIADRLNIPEKYVLHYFRPNYLDIIRSYGAPV